MASCSFSIQCKKSFMKLSYWCGEILCSCLVFDSEDKEKRSSACKQCLRNNNFPFWKAKAIFPKYQKNFFVECFFLADVGSPNLKLPIFERCWFYPVCMFGHNVNWKMQKSLEKQQNMCYSGLWSWSYWAVKFLGLLWSGNAGPSVLYRVCVSCKPVSQTLNKLTVLIFTLMP